jgi:hypothetical protein
MARQYAGLEARTIVILDPSCSAGARRYFGSVFTHQTEDAVIEPVAHAKNGRLR